ncbi:MAG: NUDIX hydrolase [Candidatus Margulisbacteria bacterium]|nr:NUDIX hydrolase [Candidatus Margulisiibacteriota bacterium]
MNEKHIHSEQIYKGRIINLKKNTVLLTNGKTATREIVEHDPAVVIIAYDTNKTIRLVKQYRTPVQQVLLEAPAGIINKGELPLNAAKRELQEETGLTATQWTSLGEAYPAPGFCNEYLYFFLAQDLQQGPPNPDEDEFLEQVTLSMPEYKHHIQTKQIIDAKTIMSFFYIKEHGL